MTDRPEMSEHPAVDHAPPDAADDQVTPEDGDVGESHDPTDPLKREGDQPGADPVTAPFPPE